MNAPATSPIAPDVQAQLRGWLKEMATVRLASKHSVEAYLHDLSSFLAFLHQHHGHALDLKQLETMEERDVCSWLAYRAGRGYAKSSNARALSAVRTFFKHLNTHAGITNLAALQVPTPKLDKPLPKAPNPAQAKAALEGLEASDREPWIAARDHAIAMLLYGSGLRISETLNLTLGDIADGQTSLRILGKGKKERQVALAARLGLLWVVALWVASIVTAFWSGVRLRIILHNRPIMKLPSIGRPPSRYSSARAERSFRPPCSSARCNRCVVPMVCPKASRPTRYAMRSPPTY